VFCVTETEISVSSIYKTL